MNRKINVVKKSNIFQSKRSVILMAIPMIAFLISVSYASAVPMPQGISGKVFMSDGITQVPTGTNFSINDTTSGSFIGGKTGAPVPGNNGYYSASINGEDGDIVVIKAWNLTHYGERTVSLVSEMTGIDVTINKLSPTSIASIVISGSPTTTLTVGQDHLFTATVRDQNNNLMDGIELTWTVSNPSVGNVTPTNTITVTGSATSTFNAKAAGTTMVNATNGLLSDTVFVIVNAGNQAPVANPNGPYTGTEGIEVSFDGSASSDSDGTVNSYSWNFGDGTPTGTGATPSHTYAQNGTYTVNLTVTDNDGTPSPAVATTATISDTNPVSAFSGTPLIGPEKLTVTFTDASTSYDGLVSRTWDFGDGNTGTETNPAHDYTSNGMYTVSLTVCENDGDCDTQTKVDYITVSNVNQAPVANPNGPYTGTEGIAVSFDGSASSDSDGTVNSYSWNFGDGTPTGTGATPSHTYAQNGTYTVNLTVTDNDGTPSPAVATTATISDTNPVSAFSGTPLIGPEPLTVTFTDASTSYDGLVSRTWDFGDGNTGTETNPTHDYTSNGTYTVSLTVCEDDGDCDTDTKADYITVGTTGIKGDVDRDGEVTAADALLYLRYAVGQDISPYVISTADDVTCDGAILADDALKVLRKAVGQDVNLVCLFG